MSKSSASRLRNEIHDLNKVISRLQKEVSLIENQPNPRKPMTARSVRARTRPRKPIRRLKSHRSKQISDPCLEEERRQIKNLKHVLVCAEQAKLEALEFRGSNHSTHYQLLKELNRMYNLLLQTMNEKEDLKDYVDRLESLIRQLITENNLLKRKQTSLKNMHC